MLRVITILVVVLGLSGHGAEAQQRDPQQVEFEKKFQREAVLVATCPGDPTWGFRADSRHPAGLSLRKELNGNYRRVEATPETVCEMLVLPKSTKK